MYLSLITNATIPIPIKDKGTKFQIVTTVAFQHDV